MCFVWHVLVEFIFLFALCMQCLCNYIFWFILFMLSVKLLCFLRCLCFQSLLLCFLHVIELPYFKLCYLFKTANYLEIVFHTLYHIYTLTMHVFSGLEFTNLHVHVFTYFCWLYQSTYFGDVPCMSLNSNLLRYGVFCISFYSQ